MSAASRRPASLARTPREARPSSPPLAELIGFPRSLHTMFYFPFSDRENIRFDPTDEPMGAVGDMAWYSMRAVVECGSGKAFDLL